MSGRVSRWAAAAAAVALSGCLVPTAPRNCLEAGTCECMQKTDCAGGLDCIDGRCGQLPDAGDGRGLFGMPCKISGECDSGLCLPSGPGNGGVCTEPCSSGVACARGWQCKRGSPYYVAPPPDAGRPPEFECVPPIDTLCQPCGRDLDCNARGDLCLKGDAGGVCGRDCWLDPCPAGYACTPIFALDGGGSPLWKQCRPLAFTCECTDVSVGLTRPCNSSNDAGHCFGHHTCQADASWSGCDAPAASREVCDGLDNDCNGLVDDDDPGLDHSMLPPGPPYPGCRKGDGGSCVGKWECLGADAGFGWFCSAKEPAPEECNALDDDCNGRVDEPFLTDAGQYLSVHDCGACGYDCETAVAHLAGGDAGPLDGAVACELRGNSPTCVPKACAPGAYLYPPPAPVECQASVSSACRPCTSDPDCQVPSDKCITVGNDPGTYCAQACDVAAPYPGCTGVVGTQGCCPTGYLCQAASGAKLCLPLGGSCSCTALRVGATRSCFVSSGAQTCVGLETCGDGGSWSLCSTAATTTELCDTADNNCNGKVDEPFINTQGSGTYDTDLHCGGCQTSCPALWSPTLQHAIGGCDAGSALPPTCRIVACTGEAISGGGECQLDGDCGPGRTCHPRYHQCVHACGTALDCGGNPCLNGYCSLSCTSDIQCGAGFGPSSKCVGARCKTDYTFVNADNEPTNGCECPKVPGVKDVPDLYSVYPDAGWPYVDRDCDLVDGEAATSLFVWSGSPSSLGTRANPYRTLSAAIAAFKPAVHSAVLVAAGSYVESVVLVNGVKLYGGYSPDFSRRDVVAYPTIIEGPEPSFTTPGYRRGTVNAEGITTDTVFAGFTVRGYDVTYRPPSGSPGKSSFALYVKDSTSALTLANNHVLGGRGGDAAPAQPGAAGQNGGSGQGGQNSKECTTAFCTTESQAGGASGNNPVCPSAVGHPGAAAVGSADPQGYTSSANGDGLGGANGTYQHSAPSQSTLCKYDCTVPGTTMNGASAQNGADGTARTPGTGCLDASGKLFGDEWIAGSGSDGLPGTASLGGGGGGAGGCVSNQIVPGCVVGNRVGDLGGTGGGGGAGGCGGGAGKGGGGGGGSFAIFVAYSGVATSYPTVRGNLVETGAGGFGANGGPGGYGGLGGAGGEGGITQLPAWCAGGGGHGGRGGNGGAGSGGGGGCGGVAYGIAGQGISAAGYSLSNYFLPVAPAAGGGAGAGGASPAGAPFAGGAGAAGLSATQHSF